MGLYVRNALHDVAALGSPGVEELRWLAPVRPGDVLTARSRTVEAWPSETDSRRGTIVGDSLPGWIAPLYTQNARRAFN